MKDSDDILDVARGLVAIDAPVSPELTAMVCDELAAARAEAAEWKALVERICAVCKARPAEELLADFKRMKAEGRV